MRTFQAPQGAPSRGRGKGRGRGRGGYYSRSGSDEERMKNDVQRAINHEKKAILSRNGGYPKQFQPPPRVNGTGNGGAVRGRPNIPSAPFSDRSSKLNPFSERPSKPNPFSERPSKSVAFGDESKKFSKRSLPPSSAFTDQSWRDPKSGDNSVYAERMNDLYQTLKKNREMERRDAIRMGVLSDPEKPTSLKDAITPVGTCQDMCPEFERVERIVQKMTDGCEKATSSSPGTKVPCEEYMVKRFRRSAAGYDEQLPSDIRPPLVLQKTLNYLFEKVVGGSKSLGSVHKFVWDRTRGIRNDFSIQQVTKVEDLRIAIDCFERIARFHILALHQLSQPSNDNVGFEHHQEREQLNNTLLSLMYYYDDSRHKLTSPNEAEFRAYCIIFEMQDQRPDMEDRAQNWPKPLLKDPRIQTAMKLYAAASNTIDEQGPLRPRTTLPAAQANHGRFWSIIGSNAVSYLLACAAEIYFNHIRGLALEAIWRAYRRGGKTKMDDLILGDLTTALGLDNEDQVQNFCQDHGLTVGEREDGQSYLDVRSVNSRWLQDSNPRRKQIFSKNLVEKKRLGRTLLAVINGLSASKAHEMGMVTGPSTAESSPSSKPNEDSLFITDDETEKSSFQSSTAKQLREKKAKINLFNPSTESQTNFQSPAPLAPKIQPTDSPSSLSTHFGEQIMTVDTGPAPLNLKSSSSSSSTKPASTTPIFGSQSFTTWNSPSTSSSVFTPGKNAQMQAPSIFQQPKVTSPPSTLISGQPSLTASSDNTTNAEKPPMTAIFGQPSATASANKVTQSGKPPSTTIFGQPSVSLSSDKSAQQAKPQSTTLFGQPSITAGSGKAIQPEKPPLSTIFGQPSVTANSDKITESKKPPFSSNSSTIPAEQAVSKVSPSQGSSAPLFFFPSSTSKPVDQAVSKDAPADQALSKVSLTQKSPIPSSFFPLSSNDDNIRNKSPDTQSTTFQQKPPGFLTAQSTAETVQPSIETAKPAFTFTRAPSAENMKADVDGLKSSNPAQPSFNFTVAPTTSDNTTKSIFSPKSSQSPHPTSFQQSEIASLSKPISNTNQLSLSQNPIQQSSTSTPLVSQNKPIKPVHDPRPKHLNQLADSIIRQDEGLLDQFIDYTTGPTILEEIEKVISEQRREDIAIARRIILSKKYVRRWRKNAYNQRLRKKGRERRKNYFESLKREQERSEIAFASDYMGFTCSASSTTDQQADHNTKPAYVDIIPASPQITSQLKRKSYGSEPADHIPSGGVIPRKKHKQTGEMSGLSPQIASKLKRKSLGSEATGSLPDADAAPHKKLKQAQDISSSSQLTNGHHKSQHGRSQTRGNSMSISQSRQTSELSSPYGDFKSAILSDGTLVDEALMKKARRLVPRARTDTTRTDYFKLKAMGIDPDTPIIPTTRKRRNPDESETTAHKQPRLSTDSSSVHPQAVPSTNGGHPAIPNPGTTPVAKGILNNEDKLEELFALSRQAREAMAESEAWFRKTRETLERSGSGNSRPSHRHSHETETEKEKKLRESHWTPSRTELRLRATNGGGFLPKDYWEKRDAIRRGSQQTNSSSSPSHSIEPLGFAAINNNKSRVLQQPQPNHDQKFGSWRREQGSNGNFNANASVPGQGGGTGASADDAIEL